MQLSASLRTCSQTSGRSSAGSVESVPSRVAYAQSSMTCSDRTDSASCRIEPCRSLAIFRRRIET